MRRLALRQVQYFADGGDDARHRPSVEPGERALDETALVYRAELVDEQIRVPSQHQQNEHGPGRDSARLAGPAAKGYSLS